MQTAASTALPSGANGIWQQLSTFDFRLIEQLCYLSRLRAAESPRKSHYCTPGRAWLAQRLGVSICTISRHTSRLRRLGVLDKLQRRPVRGRWQTCLYAVVNPAAWAVRRVRALILNVSHRVAKVRHIASPEETLTPQTDRERDFRERLARLKAIGTTV